jgi:hypothetical protein
MMMMMFGRFAAGALASAAAAVGDKQVAPMKSERKERAALKDVRPGINCSSAGNEWR